MWKQILVGLLVSGLGGVVVFFSQNLVEIFGNIPRVERNLGTTRSAYVLLGFLGMVIGLLMVFGVVPISGSPLDVGY